MRVLNGPLSVWLHLLIYQDEPMEIAAEPSAPTADYSQPFDSPQQPEAVTEPLVVVLSGRRRGRRKVMKKKTMKDEEGYLGKSTSCPS